MDKPAIHQLYGTTNLSRYLSTVIAATITHGTLPLGDGNGTVQRGGAIQLAFAPPHRGYGSHLQLDGDSVERFLAEVAESVPKGTQVVTDGIIVPVVGAHANLYYAGRSLQGFELLSTVARDIRAYDLQEMHAAVGKLGQAAKEGLTTLVDEGVKGLRDLLRAE